MKLIDGKALHEKVCNLEEQARKLVLNTPKGSPDYIRYKERLNAITEFKYMVFDEPVAYDVEMALESAKDFLYALKKYKCPTDKWNYHCEDYKYCDECKGFWLLRIIEKGGVDNEVD